MKIVVTGGLGHIGSRLIRYLPTVDEDVEIIIIDNLMTFRYCSLFNLPRSKYKFVQANILTDDLSHIFENTNVVIHLAAITDAASSFDNEELVEQTNYEGTKIIAGYCMRFNLKLIFPSTTSVYGSQEETVDECCTDDQLMPQSPYAQSKRMAEKFLQEKWKLGELDCVILRLGTIFGISQGIRFHTAVNKFIWQACNGIPITVWRTAINQKRPYLDIEDAIKAVNHVIKNQIFDGEIYNVLTINATVSDIIEEIKKRINSVKVEFVDSKIMNQLSYNVLGDKFIKTGFEYNGSLSRAVDDTIHLLEGII